MQERPTTEDQQWREAAGNRQEHPELPTLISDQEVPHHSEQAQDGEPRGQLHELLFGACRHQQAVKVEPHHAVVA